MVCPFLAVKGKNREMDGRIGKKIKSEKAKKEKSQKSRKLEKVYLTCNPIRKAGEIL